MLLIAVSKWERGLSFPDISILEKLAEELGVDISELVCPKTGVILPYKNIDKTGYKKYYDRKACENCPFQKECCKSIKYRTIRRLINERARKRRLSKEGKVLFKKRRTTVERSFGDSKQNHGYRFTLFKGVEKNQAYTHLICATQNMKNMSIKRDNIINKSLIYSALVSNIINFYQNLGKITLKIFA